MRLVDVDAAIHALSVASRGDSKDVIRNLVIRFLLALPTVDAVPVIRCKDCKFVGTDATCCLVCKRDGMGLKPFHVYHDDYCSYAERKEE